LNRPLPEPSRRSTRSERLIALFLLGCVAFSPPLLRMFGTDAALFGWPLLYLYAFTTWAGLIIGVALLAEQRPPARDDTPKPDDR
jgi:hypothetical protein